MPQCGPWAEAVHLKSPEVPLRPAQASSAGGPGHRWRCRLPAPPRRLRLRSGIRRLPGPRTMPPDPVPPRTAHPHAVRGKGQAIGRMEPVPPKDVALRTPSRWWNAPRRSADFPSFAVPAQKRPQESVVPSLNLSSDRWASGSAMCSLAPVAGSKNQKPDFAAMTGPPRSRTAKQPTGSLIFTPEFRSASTSNR